MDAFSVSLALGVVCTTGLPPAILRGVPRLRGDWLALRPPSRLWPRAPPRPRPLRPRRPPRDAVLGTGSVVVIKMAESANLSREENPVHPPSTRMAAAAASRGGNARARVVRLPPSALHPPSAAAFTLRPPSAYFRCELFTLHLYPLHAAAVASTRAPHLPGTRTPAALGPPWLPWPPLRATHEARHLRRASAAASSELRELRTTIFMSKKRVHKHAVVRNRCRTRLMAALRDVVERDGAPVRDGTWDVSPH